MKLRTISLFVFVVAISLVISNADCIYAAADLNGFSKATLQGSFGFYLTGFNQDGPVAGNGNNHGRQTISRNGVFEHLEFEGTYEVNPDCTTDSGAIIVDGGNEVYNLSRTSGNAVYVVLRKMQ